MKQIISCKFNIDTTCVELKFTDGSMLSIDTIAVENEVANNMYERSELDYLIYNDPAAYADLILNDDPEKYLKAVTEYKPLDRIAIEKKKEVDDTMNTNIDDELPKIFWKYYDEYRRKKISLKEYSELTGIKENQLKIYVSKTSEHK